jgi:hypothetical protein
MNDSWEGEIGALLAELAEVQTGLLSTFADKRRHLAAGDQAALLGMQSRERELADRLQACHERRQQLLAQASAEGVAADSIQSLSDRLPAASRDRLHASIRESANRTKLLQHQSLANWVLVQRSLLHLSQLIEIIATGGRPKPTYGKGSERGANGALVDRAA